MINSRKLFDDSETAHPITEEEMIKLEKIHGTLLLIGAEDDAANWFWNLYETGISGGKKVSERMSECTDGY